jgi:D-alanyl-D-alanine carboxypeptidase
VVFGGSSAGSRDERVRELIHDHIAEASVQHTAAPLVAEAGKPAGQTYAVASAVSVPVTVTPSKPESNKAESGSKAKPETKSAPAYALASAASVTFALPSKSDPKAAAKVEASKPDAKSGQTYAVASAESVPITLTSKSDPSATTTVQVPRWTATNSVAAGRTAPAIGSEDPIRPVPVKTVLVKAGSAVQTASLAPLQLPAAAETPAPVSAPAPVPVNKTAVLPFPPPGTRPGAIGGLPSRVTTTGSIADSVPVPAVAPSPLAPSVSAAVTPASSAPAPSALAPSAPAPVAPAPTHSAAAPPAQAHTGWIIQVGAFPAEGEAKQRLSSVQSKASHFLASADAFTESVSKGESVLYRARFAGLGKEQAEAACKYLKHNDVDCMTIKN